jgi:ribosomal protein L12E/L44/L45/RPP1/RPP2
VSDMNAAGARLDELIALCGRELPPLRAAIAKLDRQDADEVLLAAVMRLASIAAAESMAALAADRDERSPAEDDELPVDDPFEDRGSPYSAMLDRGRTLRIALTDQPNLSAVFNAVGTLSDDDRALVVLELAFDAWYTKHDAGAEH